MARKRHDGRGWTIRQESPQHVAYVRFTVGGRELERSTGTKDPLVADVEAAKIVARERAGEYAASRKRTRRGATGRDLAPLVAEWLVWLEATHARTTIRTWSDYSRSHFLPFFGSTSALTNAGCLAYQRARLGKVEGTTVRKEQTALRSLLAYLLEVGAIPEAVEVPRLPKRATGTTHPVRRRRTAPPLSRAETLAVIRKLPEWSSSRKVDRFPIRARFVIGYETGLRPSTLDRLSVPEHYRAGSAVFRLDRETVKERWARDVPLTRRARRILDYLLRALGPDYAGALFGWHNYREHIAAAAGKALAPETAERFCAAHLRSAMLTHRLADGAPMPAVQWLVGHTMISTTARYVKPAFEMAAALVQPPRRSPKQPQSKPQKRKRSA